MLSLNSGKNGVGNAVVNVGALTPHPRNYNQHSPAQVGDLRRSLRRFGQVRSIVVQAQAEPGRWLIVAGHGIVAAARAEGVESLRADVIPADWNDAMVLAYLAADNELARQGQPDEAQLAALLRDVQAQADRELAALAAGSEARLTEMLATLDGGAAGDAEPQVDRAAELQEKWQVKPGDLWRIGAHRLLCGDSTKAADVARVMGGEKAELCFTSPPYAEQRKEQYGGTSAAQYWDWFTGVECQVRAALSPGGNFVLNIKPHAEDKQRSLYVFDLVCSMVRKSGWLFVDEFCWLRTGIPQQVVNRFKNAFEPCYWFAASSGYAWYPRQAMHRSDSVPLALGKGAGDTNAARRQGKGGGAIQGNDIIEGMAYPSNVLDFKQNAAAVGHPAAFPPQLPSFFVGCMTPISGIVYEPFAGSGTTLVACENLGRRGRGIEISPEYCAVVLERMATAFAGIEIERMLPRAKMDDDENGAK